ncbi:MAG TPA: TIM barrel protein [Limnochordia bacterium]|nr:TIM barrel protein [Limnochordia bacterium]
MAAPLSNALILFNNHFTGHRRHYPYRTRLAIAADLGYDGYEFHPIEPDNDPEWSEAAGALRASGLRRSGMYVVAKGITDDEAAEFESHVARLQRIIRRLAEIKPKPFLNLTISSNPSPGSSAFHEAGSARAEARHWRRAADLVAAADRELLRHGMEGNLYNHVWFMLDTPQAILRTLELAGARAIRPGVATFHAHFHQGAPDVSELLDAPGMERLGYVALLNAWPAPAPFRTVHLDEGQIDIAAWLAHLRRRHYAGPLVLQAYDLGGDPYVSAQRSIAYVRAVWERLARNPSLDPWQSI